MTFNKALITLLLTNLIALQAEDPEQRKIDNLELLYKTSKDISIKKSVLKDLSNIYDDMGDWDGYDRIIQQMFHFQEEIQDSSYLAEIHNKIGISNCSMGKNTEALVNFKNALKVYQATGQASRIANSYENMGLVYKEMGDYKNSIDCQLKSLEIRTKLNHPRIFNNFMKLAVLHQLLSDYDREAYYVQLARSEMQKQGRVSERNKAIFYNELGNIANTRGQYDSCIVFYKNVIHFSNQISWRTGIAEGLGNLADVYSKTGLSDSAIFYHRKSLRLSLDIQDCMGSTEEYLSLAKLFQTEGRADSVLYYANEALKRAKECDLLNQQALIYKFMADYHRDQNNHARAYALLVQHYAIEDSISSSELKSNIAELETKYETSIKEQKIVLLTAENQLKNQRIQLSWVFIALLIVLIGLILLLLGFRRKQANYKHLDLQQQLLRSQMNPHFIFNVMGSIQSFLYKNEPSKAGEYLSRFASLSRSVLDFSTKESIYLKEEIDMLKDYIELERARMKIPFDLVYTLDPELEQDLIQVPPMLLQPFVENAIKHGFKNIDYKGILNLSFTDDKDSILVEITDNGKGLSSHSDSSHTSKALTIFKQRKKGIEQLFRKKVTFELHNLNTETPGQHGVRVIIHLPILNDD